jgi:arsenate reductase-like glutaredoxin family protein
MLVTIYKITGSHIQKYRDLDTLRRKNLKSQHKRKKQQELPGTIKRPIFFDTTWAA